MSLAMIARPSRDFRPATTQPLEPCSASASATSPEVFFFSAARSSCAISSKGAGASARAMRRTARREPLVVAIAAGAEKRDDRRRQCPSHDARHSLLHRAIGRLRRQSEQNEDAVFRTPGIGPIAEIDELDGKHPHLAHRFVDSRAIGDEHVALLGRQCFDDLGRHTLETRGSRSHIHRHGVPAEDFREPAGRRSTAQIHLKQSISRRRIAERLISVSSVLGVNLRNMMSVEFDLDARGEAGKNMRAILFRQGQSNDRGNDDSCRHAERRDS